MICLNATFFRSVSSTVLGLSTSKQVWFSLGKEFSDQFVSRRTILRNQLHNIRKYSDPMIVYLHHIKEITDSLVAINEHVSELDLMTYTLNGVGREYDNFVISTQNRDVPFTFGALKSRLIQHKQWITS